jgi:lipoyl(octanoyl) transferase
MNHFTQHRQANTADELWLVEHPAVFTLGKQGKREHLLKSSDIPVINTDRGGQITYHGPGQLVAYPLLDLKRLPLNVRELVTAIENTLIHLLQEYYNITAQNRPVAPGVYVDGAKIASLGLRIKKRCSYHGLALNTAMDLTPFSFINPCGMSQLKITQIADFYPQVQFNKVAEQLVNSFRSILNYQHIDYR